MERNMTRDFKVLLACNIVTMLLSGIACYFAYEAKTEAVSADFTAEWGSRNAAGAFDDIQQKLSKIKQATDELADRADREDRLLLPPQYRN